MKEKIWVEKDGYLVLRDGSIYKLNWGNTGKMRKIKQSNNGNGYLCFTCNHERILVHRFVASCFIPNPDNLPCVNHKNEIKNDNRVENLEWCTYEYNTNYGTRNERAGESITKALKNHPKLSKKVLQFTLDGVFVREWESVNEIERVLGFSKGYISACCRGKHEQAYDFLWRYK